MYEGDPAFTKIPAELTDKVKELFRLAQEQGYLTYGDINDALPDGLMAPADIDEICIQLRPPSCVLHRLKPQTAKPSLLLTNCTRGCIWPAGSTAGNTCQESPAS